MEKRSDRGSGSPCVAMENNFPKGFLRTHYRMIRQRETAVTRLAVSFYRLYLTQVCRITLTLFAIMPIAFFNVPAKAQDVVGPGVVADNFST